MFASSTTETAGVRLLWVIYPLERRAEVWRPGEQQPVETLGMADYLDAQEVVPGFRIAARDGLFSPYGQFTTFSATLAHRIPERGGQ